MSLDLKELERKLDEALAKETTESLKEWLSQERSKILGRYGITYDNGIYQEKNLITHADFEEIILPSLEVINDLELDKKKEVLTFIQYLNSEIRERPQCMLFAMMLKLKFDDAQIKYSTGHFITLIDGHHYDWDGMWIDDTKGFTEFPVGWGDNHIVNNYNAMKEIFRRD